MNDNIASAVADFLAHKRALGRKYLTEEATLRLLQAFAGQHQVEYLGQLRPGLLEEFVASRPRQRARSYNHLVGILGCFLDWAVTQQRMQALRWQGARRRETDRRLLFLFDPTQARRLLRPSPRSKQRLVTGRLVGDASSTSSHGRTRQIVRPSLPPAAKYRPSRLKPTAQICSPSV